MYQGTKVVDVHGHMTTPAKFRGFAMNLMTIRSPRNKFEMSDEELDRALGPHIDALNTRNIDFQLLSPRPVAMTRIASAPLASCRSRPTKIRALASMNSTAASRSSATLAC